MEVKQAEPGTGKQLTIADAIYSVAELKQFVSVWLAEQAPLFEAFWLAAAVHVLAFPLVWFIGWALPWPETSVMTTVVEIDLSNWPDEARPKKVIKFRDPELNQ